MHIRCTLWAWRWIWWKYRLQCVLFSICVHVFACICSFLPLNQSEVRSPVLLLWGERDAFLEQDMAEACRLYIRNHFRLNIISGASHWLQQDQPDIVNTLIWTFLKEGEGRKNYRNWVKKGTLFHTMPRPTHLLINASILFKFSTSWMLINHKCEA